MKKQGGSLMIKRAILMIGCLIILSGLIFFVYTRFLIDQYEMSGHGKTLKIDNATYTVSNRMSISDEENLGKTIGIAIEGKRTFTDYIWPYWVIEYSNDKEHKRLFVRGLMGSGGLYIKNSK